MLLSFNLGLTGFDTKMNDQNERPDDQFGDDSGSQSEGEMTYESTDLFRGRRVVVIQHGGESYRLIETRNGKLILQK